MANTYTPTYNLIMPEVGADLNMWGTHLNSDISTIDTHMVSRALTTSQTIAGPININNTLLVHGAATFDSTALITGKLTASAAVEIGTTLSVGGNTTLSGTLSITGNSITMPANTLNVGSGQLLTTSGGVSTTGSMGISLSLTVGTTLGVTGASTLAAVTASGLLSANGGIQIQNAYPNIAFLDAGGANYYITNDGGVFGARGPNASPSWLYYSDSLGNMTISGAATLGGGLTIQNTYPNIALNDTNFSGSTGHYAINCDGGYIGFRGPNASPSWLCYADKYGSFNVSKDFSAAGNASVAKNVLIGTSVAGGSANCVIAIAQGTPPTGAVSNVGRIYIDSGDLMYMDPAGTAYVVKTGNP